MKKAICIVGALTALVTLIGFFLMILGFWGLYVEYYAYKEWHNAEPEGTSSLVRATLRNGLQFLGVGVLTGATTVILQITDSVRKRRNIRNIQKVNFSTLENISSPE